MSDICPNCGNELKIEWDVNAGVWKTCSNCDYRTPDGSYTSGNNIFSVPKNWVQRNET